MNKELLQQALDALEESGVFTSEQLVRRHSAIKALREAITQPVQEDYDQTALELCDVCGWKTLIPSDCCLNCERFKFIAQPVSSLTLDALSDFIQRTNEDYSAWCKTYYLIESLDERGMMSLHGLWAWQEQERRKVHKAIAAAQAVPVSQPLELTEAQVDVGIRAMLQCSSSDLESYGTKMYSIYKEEVERVYKALVQPVDQTQSLFAKLGQEMYRLTTTVHSPTIPFDEQLACIPAIWQNAVINGVTPDKQEQLPTFRYVASIHPANLTNVKTPWCHNILLYSADNEGDFPEKRVRLYVQDNQTTNQFTQPAQIPLTSIQLFANDDLMAFNGSTYGLPMSEIIKMVRVIEAAHGIKEIK